jgi:hypothetical protein
MPASVKNSIRLLGCVLVALLSSGLARAAELGIDRSNLTSQNEAVMEKTLQDIHALHATWFRDALSAARPEFQAKFVLEVKLAKQNHLKFLANVLPAYTDYDKQNNENGGEEFRKRCGWPQGSAKLSEINLAKFAQRLRTQLDLVKAANLSIDAFEIGNEVDWICFNGDVPNGHAPTPEELLVIVRGYGEFLKMAALVIRDPHYFPEAKIITGGIAHGSDKWDQPPHHISNPGRMIAMLRNVKGYNYLDNSQYHVDGYGTHVYPWPDDTAVGIRATLQQDAELMGRDKPFWVTEWGFMDPKALPTKSGKTLSQCIQEALATFDSSGIPLGPIFFYRYDVWLTDKSGSLLPVANVLGAYAAKH